MLMFRFWSSDSRGSEKALHSASSMLDLEKSLQPIVSAKFATAPSPTPPPPQPRRPRPSDTTTATQSLVVLSSRKRPRVHDNAGPPRKKVALPRVSDSCGLGAGVDKERAREVIQHQFGLEILLKHDELRLINQELAKCQVALEQLRRCHLIPYPINVPTPQQMLDISDGSGPALETKTGDRVPQWAPPFGVTDGPYTRHYAKWLIPDPKFDGIVPDAPPYAETSRLRHAPDGRATRHGCSEATVPQTKSRPTRAYAGQKLHSLSSGYPQPKDKAGPCVLKRADGQTVKLVCIDCKRDNFSSTQGFINHCRIAHKRDFKSHEEAAVHCGHPIEPTGGGSVTGDEKAVAAPTPAPIPPPAPAPPVGLVHPMARENASSASEACFSVVARIQQSLDLYSRGKLPGITSVPGCAASPAASKPQAPQRKPDFAPSQASPYLSSLLEGRGFDGNLGVLVEDAKTKIDLDQVSSPEEEYEEADVNPQAVSAGTGDHPSLAPRMRVPARANMSPASVTAAAGPTSSERLSPQISYATSVPISAPVASRTVPDNDVVVDEDLVEADLSPNTAISNNAPSLVSDDGDYDDSVDGSDEEPEVNDSLEADSLSDVAEIYPEDEHAAVRSLRHDRASTGAATETVRLRSEDNKHVAFVSPVQKARGQRGPKVK